MPYITRLILLQIKLISIILRPLCTRQPVRTYKNLRNGCWINLPPKYLIIAGKFPAMSGPPAHIHLKEGATHKANPNPNPNPIPVPYFYKEEVKKKILKKPSG